jgi:hypothetical protein
MEQKKLSGRVERFKECQKIFVDDARSGHPLTVTSVEQIDQHIWDNRRINIDKTASEMTSSQ